MTKYRPDIDGLRALAVLPVIFFHAGLPFLSGGYVGVDVFFVISGFLITSIIAPEVEEARFSIVRFYERRARRLMPALFVVVMVTAVLSWWLLLSEAMKDFAQSVASTALFSSNVLFFMEAGYFDAPAEDKPLLHTWSLAVEEQFYLGYPLVLLAVKRFLPGRSVFVVALLMAVSFLANVLVVGSHQSAAFYLIPFRAWELGIGALLALHQAPPLLNARVAAGAGIVGVLMIVVSVAVFDSRTMFPGFAAAAPCLGAALIIWSGRMATGLGYRLLASKPMVLIGKISYSLYLWHWPLLVFARFTSPTGKLEPMPLALALATTFLASYLSWRFVENPFRRKWPSRRAVFALTGVVTVMWVGFGVAGHVTNGLPSRIPEDVAVFEHANVDFRPGPHECRLLAEDDRFCVIGVQDQAPTFLLWGDSHAGILSHGVVEAAKRAGKSGLFSAIGGCPPFVGVSRDESVADQAEDLRCEETNSALMRLLDKHPEIDTVLFIGRWSYYSNGVGIGVDDHHTVDIWFSETGDGRGLDQNARVFRQALTRTVSQLSSSGRRVFLLEQVPEFGRYRADIVARLLTIDAEGTRQNLAELTTTSRADLDQRQRTFHDTVASPDFPEEVTVIPTHGLFCGEATCDVMQADAPRYFDNNHITTTTARELAEIFDPAMAGK